MNSGREGSHRHRRQGSAAAHCSLGDEGASVPIYLFADIFRAPVIGLPTVNHDNTQRAANDNQQVQNLWGGIQTYAAMMAELSW
jgi:hypothetical protein